jgi:ABC-type antimicrobial peptide transport system permease subunit
VLRAALADVRARRGRALVAAAGVAAAALMAGTAITVSYALDTGFDRAAERADLPDVIVRFDPRAVADVDARVRALPNVRARSYRYEGLGFQLRAGRHATSKGAVEVALGQPRGYAVVSGHDLSRCGCDVVVERGLAQRWGLRPGSRLRVEGFGSLRVRGVAVAPDNVAFPVSSVARVWVTQAAVRRVYGRPLEEANVLQIWARNRAALAQMLVQAREASFGLTDVRILTRAGVRVLIDRAAGLVIALLVAFSVVALGAATTMLAVSAHADVQRRLAAIGIERALGFRSIQVAAHHVLAATLLAAPAAALGLVAGALLASGPSGRLLEAVNELPPGAALAWPLAGAFLAIVGVVAAASAIPAWRAASKRPAAILRGADIARAAPRLAVGAGPGGLAALGVRLIAARRARALAVVAVLGTSTAVVLLMLGLASVVDRLAHDPLVLGKRYQLQLPMPAGGAAAVQRVPGVAHAAPRYTVEAADSFDLGETMKLIAYPGDHRPFESAPLAAGRRVATPDEAEVGTALADALGLVPGTTLPALLPNGRELRFRVVGVVRALDNDGRVAFVRSGRLLRADPAISPLLVVRVRPGAEIGVVRRRIAGTSGTVPSRPGAATPRTGGFLSILAALLRVVAVVNGLICLYVVVQTLAITAHDRRPAIALLRALGARRRAVASVFAGAALAVAVPGALAGALLEREVLAPVVSRLAGDYVSLPLGTRAADIAIVAAGVVALAALAAGWTSRRSVREPIAAGLREE